jgi:hypothetical protein
MMQRHSIHAPHAAAMILLSLLGGCALRPWDGDSANLADEIYVTGYATAPDAEIRISAKVGSSWVLVSTIHADEEASTNFRGNLPNFDTPLYAYETDLVVPESYWSSSDTVTLQVSQVVGANPVPVYMYDYDGFFNCLATRWFAADQNAPYDVRNAGIECSQDRHEVTVHR